MTLVAGPAAASAHPLVTQPGRFHDDFDARLATGPKRTLWLAETGTDRQGKLRTRVFRFDGGRWVALPGRPRSTSNSPLSLAVAAAGKRRSARPCVGFASIRRGPRVRCYSGHRWTTIRLAGPLRGMSLVGLGPAPRGRGLVALFFREGRHSTRVRLARLEGARLSAMGPALDLNGQVLASLGQSAADVGSTGVDVGLEDLRHGKSWVATLRRSGWSRTGTISTHSGGPQPGGPVRLRGSLLDALTEAEGDWPMTVHAWADGHWSEVGGGPLNVGSARAQGSLSAVGNRAWATWVQTGPAAGGMFPTSYYAALLDPSAGKVKRRILLWHGKSIGPGHSQAIAYRGRPVFLYMRQRGRKGGLHANVAFYGRGAGRRRLAGAGAEPPTGGRALGAASSGAPVYAPYVDVTLTPTYPFQRSSANPATSAYLGFVVSKRSAPCTPSWGADYTLGEADAALSLRSRAARLRRRGGGAIVSFGGAANSELALRCTDQARLRKAYLAPVRRYRSTAIDLDIEGAALADRAANARRARAIAAIQRQRRNLEVWLTLPVSDRGLTPEARAVVRGMLAAKVRLAGVNAMTMDFGPGQGAHADIAATVERSLRATHRQVRSLWRAAGLDGGAASAWRHLGATPMLGVNDVTDQRFTIGAARQLAAFVARKGIPRVSAWSLNRDSPCARTGVLSDNCSGVAQSRLQFGRIFGRLRDSGG